MSAKTTVESQAPDQLEIAENQDPSPAKALFLGEIIQSAFWPFPHMAPEQSDMLNMVVESVDRFLAEKKDDFREWDRNGEQPEEFITALRELGLFGLIIPEEYGGIGLSNAGYSRVLQQSSRHDSSASLTIGAHSSIGMKGLLLFGTDVQKKQYLPRLASGELIAAFCLTEPGSGSDAASIKTSACKDSNGDWILNGEKIWVSNGGLADFFTVFARTDCGGGKISAFMVERDFPGVASGKKEDKLGIRASSTTAVSFTDVKVPAENLLGDEGKGFKIAMSILNNGRTGLGGGAVGGMKTCIAVAARQAVERKQFGQSIAQFGLIKKKISGMVVDCFAAESAVWMIAHYIDSGYSDYSTEAAISKVFASEAMFRAANESLQIAAGSGYMKELPYERILRDSRILTIFEGTNEILRLFIALSGMKARLGSPGNHPGPRRRSHRSHVTPATCFPDPGPRRARGNIQRHRAGELRHHVQGACRAGRRDLHPGLRHAGYLRVRLLDSPLFHERHGHRRTLERRGRAFPGGHRRRRPGRVGSFASADHQAGGVPRLW